MGLAPFFDRARQGAAQILRDFDAKAFEARLGEVTVAIAFDTNAAASFEGLAALDMTARLVARLYPRVRVRALDGDGAQADELIALMRSINPDIDIVDAAIGEEIALVAGTTAISAPTVVYFGSDRWIARVSTDAPVGFATSANPFGAGAAACVAAANLFRAVFGRWLAKPELDDNGSLSLLNFETGSKAANADLPLTIDLKTFQLVGIGAIGNAIIWSLSRLRGLAGMVHLIDHETIELTNLQRYVLTGMEHDGASKVGLAAAALQGSGLGSGCFSSTWAEYVAGVGHHAFDTVAVALDTARDRVQVQSSLPRRIVNGWTQAGDLGVSRHGFGGEDACLACLYLPAGSRRNEDEIVAEELCFPPEEIMKIRSLLHFGQPLDESMVRMIAGRVGVGADRLLPFVGLPLRAFRQKVVCGNTVMRAADGGGADVEVPMAFQSALAGVMMAAELVGTAADLRSAPPVRTVIDLMRRLPGRVSFPARRGGAGAAKCICEDRDHLEVYREKYGA